MNDPRLVSLLDEASVSYNNGTYDRAIALWRQVLALDPDNQRAREGIRMSSLLGTQWKEPTGIAASAPPVNAKIAAAVERVRTLMRAGALDDAREGLALLRELAPVLPEVNLLAKELEQASSGASFPTVAPDSDEAALEACLSEARRALLGGQNAAATVAAERALALDPGNMEACGILSRAADEPSVAAGSAPMSQPPKPAAIPRAVAGVVREDARVSLEDDLIPLDPAEVEPADETSVSASPAATAGGIDRVAVLLAQGKREADSGRIEDAIATWSRVFAVDSANAEAGALIDSAKSAIEERGRQVDQLYYSGVDAIEAGRTDEGLALLRQVLTVNPLHLEAKERLEEVEHGRARAGAPIVIDQARLMEAEKEKAVARAEAREDVFEDQESVPLAMSPHRSHGAAARGGHDSDALSGSASAPNAAFTRVQAASGNARRLAAAAGGLLVVGAGIGAWLWLGSENGSMKEAQAEPAAVTSPPTPPLPRPREAVAAAPSGGHALQVLPGTASKPVAPAPEPVPESSSGQREADALEKQGRRYYEEGRWAESVLALRRALELHPVEFDSRDQLDSAMKKLEQQAKLERETEQSVRLFNEGDYASALHKFYRLQQDYPGMKQFDRWIVTSWFNWGVTLLQAASVDEAAEKFDEVLAITPGDREAVKARDIAKRYHRARADAGLTAFANALSLRPLSTD